MLAASAPQGLLTRALLGKGAVPSGAWSLGSFVLASVSAQTIQAACPEQTDTWDILDRTLERGGYVKFLIWACQIGQWSCTYRMCLEGGN